MSPILHLDVEAVYPWFVQARATSLDLEAQTQQLLASAGGMDWISPSKDALEEDLRAACQQVQSCSEQLTQLAERLHRVVEQWSAAAETISGETSLPNSGGWSPNLPEYLPVLIPIIGLPPIFIIGILPYLPDWIEEWRKRLEPTPPNIVSPPPGWKEEPEELPSAEEPVAEEPPAAPAEQEPGTESKPAGPPHDVPVKSQHGLTVGKVKTGYGCAPTSASMITDYWHHQDETNPTLSAQELIDRNAAQDDGNSGGKQFGANSGMGLDDLQDDMESLGYKMDIYTSESGQAEDQTRLLKEAIQKGPVMVNVRTGMSTSGYPHTVVVSNIAADGTVTINDPFTGERTEYSWADFDQSWGSDFGKSHPTRIFATIEPPSQQGAAQ